MLSYLWGFMIIIGIVVGIFNGNIAEVGNAAINSSKEAVSLCISMVGIMTMWTGMMQVAKKCGLVASFTKALRPVISLLFRIPKGHVVNEYIASNMIANILGLAGQPRLWD